MVTNTSSQILTTPITHSCARGVNIGYMDNLGSNIRRRIRQLDTTQTKVAEDAGVSHVLISRLIKGDVKTSGKLPEIATALGLTVEQLVSGDFGGGPVTLVRETEKASESVTAYSLGHIDAWDSSTPLGEDEVELPLFREVELAAGSGCTQVQENHGAKLRFAKSTLRRKGIDQSHAACCFVSGDSMDPVLPDGSTVGVDTAAKQIVDGKMYAIDHGGLLRVKYLYRIPGGGIRIRSANRDEYPDEDLTPDQLEHFRVIGRVFWYSVLL